MTPDEREAAVRDVLDVPPTLAIVEAVRNMTDDEWQRFVDDGFLGSQRLLVQLELLSALHHRWTEDGTWQNQQTGQWKTIDRMWRAVVAAVHDRRVTLVGPGEKSTFGDLLVLRGDNDAPFGKMIRHAIAEGGTADGTPLAQSDYEQQVVEQDAALSTRCQPGPGTTWLKPGHIPWLRSRIMAAHEPLSNSPGAQDGIAELTRSVIAAAQPVFLTHDVVEVLGRMDPPDDETLASMQLPFDSCFVVFANPYEIVGPLSIQTEHDEKWADGTERYERVGRRTRQADDVDSMMLAASAMAAVHGVVLTADREHGGIGPGALWLVSLDTSEVDEIIRRDGNPTPRKMHHSFIAWGGTLASSTLESMARNVAAFIALRGGQAAVTGDEPLPSGKPLRKLAKTSQFRKRAERGGYSSIRVIELTRGDRAAMHPDAEPTGRTVEPHWRKGHYRRQRHGPRDNWWYETTLIMPTYVGGGDAGPAPTPQVWDQREAG